MVEKIIQLALKYPLAVVLCTLALAGYGFYSLKHLPIDAVPDITNNQVQINTVIPGLSPSQVEKLVTYPLETALSGIADLELTRSISRNGFSQITAVFDDKVNIYFARQQINEKLMEVKEDLPEGADPSMGAISTGLGEIYMWTVDFIHPNGAEANIVDGSPGWQSDGSYLTLEKERLVTDYQKASYLRTVQDWIIKPQLKGTPGLADIDTLGGYVRQYHVEPNMESMVALGITFDDIVEALRKNNQSIGPGYIEKNGESLLIKADERLDKASQIESIVISSKNGLPVRLQDIAEIRIGKEMRTGSASENGHEVVVGTALMLIGANSRTVSQAVDQKLQEINLSLPPDIEAKTVLNRTKLVNATIHTVIKNLSEGAFLVIAVLFALLGYFRAALITAFVIPLSMLMTSIGMLQFKISGNLMSLGAIDFGLIVDGAVIITENCLRRLSLKQHELGRLLNLKERMNEVMSASKEMIQPSIFGQLIIITVYIPILTLSGVEGKMFHPMAMTVIFALISAFILSITFIPAMIGLFVKGRLSEKENKIVQTAKNVYEPVLKWSLSFPWIAISSGIAVIIIAGSLFTKLGEEFVPTLDEKDIAMHAMRIPSTSLTQSTEMQLEVEKALLNNFPEIAFAFSKTGTAEMATDPMPPNISDTFIILKPQNEWPDPSLTKNDLIERIETILRQVPGNNYEFTQPIEMRFNELISGVRSDVAIKIYGDDFEVMGKTAEKIASVLQGIKGAADVKASQVDGLPSLDIQINREIISRMGLNVYDVMNVLSTALGGQQAGQIYEGDRHFDIIVKLPDSIREDFQALQNLPIPLPPNEKNDIAYIPLKEVVSLKVSNGLNEIARENGKRFITVQANVRGSDLGTFVEEAKQKIKAHVKIPEGYWITWGGQFENLLSARARLMIVVPICFSLILILLFMAFNSIKEALLVFSGVPLALTGGIIALWIRDMPFSISAAVGFIALSGIAVLNGLVLITFIDHLIKDGVKVEEALIRGPMTRLRPVLMTALVASLGFIPMALTSGTGSEVQKPLATVVIGGLISSTLLTLLVLPALYKVFARKDTEDELSTQNV